MTSAKRSITAAIGPEEIIRSVPQAGDVTGDHHSDRSARRRNVNGQIDRSANVES